MDDYRANGHENCINSITQYPRYRQRSSIDRKLIISEFFFMALTNRLTVIFNFFCQHTNSLSRASIRLVLDGLYKIDKLYVTNAPVKSLMARRKHRRVLDVHATEHIGTDILL